MKTIPVEKGVTVFSWCPEVEESALSQIRLIAEQPFTKYCALMPDAHTGMGMPIGGVAAFDNVVSPNCVGVDIGCGMCAVKSSLRFEDFTKEMREELLHSFTRSVPVGFAHNSQARIKELQLKYAEKFDYGVHKSGINFFRYDAPDPLGDVESAFWEQIGTLGGGNHFIEVQYDKDGNVWLMLHSGSRNIGKRVCDFFNDVASTQAKLYYSSVPDSIPFLPATTQAGKAYLAWMDFALRFAFLNRQAMMDYLKKDVRALFAKFNRNVDFESVINIHHNYASLENHFGRNYWVHRKGATLASSDTIGIIPGSCGTKSFIVQGLGNPKSLMSCSHGSGRVMGRKEFNRRNNTPEGLKAIQEMMKDITHLPFKKERSFKKNRNPDDDLLDVSEAPTAYKNVEDVMANQQDLVKPIVELTPFISLKE